MLCLSYDKLTAGTNGFPSSHYAWDPMKMPWITTHKGKKDRILGNQWRFIL